MADRRACTVAALTLPRLVRRWATRDYTACVIHELPAFLGVPDCDDYAALFAPVDEHELSSRVLEAIASATPEANVYVPMQLAGLLPLPRAAGLIRTALIDWRVNPEDVETAVDALSALGGVDAAVTQTLCTTLQGPPSTLLRAPIVAAVLHHGGPAGRRWVTDLLAACIAADELTTDHVEALEAMAAAGLALDVPQLIRALGSQDFMESSPALRFVRAAHLTGYRFDLNHLLAAPTDVLVRAVCIDVLRGAEKAAGAAAPRWDAYTTQLPSVLGTIMEGYQAGVEVKLLALAAAQALTGDPSHAHRYGSQLEAWARAPTMSEEELVAEALRSDPAREWLLRAPTVAAPPDGVVAALRAVHRATLAGTAHGTTVAQRESAWPVLSPATVHALIACAERHALPAQLQLHEFDGSLGTLVFAALAAGRCSQDGTQVTRARGDPTACREHALAWAAYSLPSGIR